MRKLLLPMLAAIAALACVPTAGAATLATIDSATRQADGSALVQGTFNFWNKLPAVYAEHFRTQIYNERVVYPGAWNKLVVVAREDDHATMLNHALIQSRRRYRT